jgi:ribosomal protein S18 acetylase RimI-like enzyme
VTAGRLDVRPDPRVELSEALQLYGSVGWTAYSDRPEVLAAALAGADLVLTARLDQDLVGLARTVSDGASICYVQDLLVRPDVQRRGVGRALMAELLARYRHCRQFVLITDRDAPGVHAFYRSSGLVEGEESGTAVFVRFS